MFGPRSRPRPEPDVSALPLPPPPVPRAIRRLLPLVAALSLVLAACGAAATPRPSIPPDATGSLAAGRRPPPSVPRMRPPPRAAAAFPVDPDRGRRDDGALWPRSPRRSSRSPPPRPRSSTRSVPATDSSARSRTSRLPSGGQGRAGRERVRGERRRCGHREDRRARDRPRHRRRQWRDAARTRSTSSGRSRSPSSSCMRRTSTASITDIELTGDAIGKSGKADDPVIAAMKCGLRPGRRRDGVGDEAEGLLRDRRPALDLWDRGRLGLRSR